MIAIQGMLCLLFASGVWGAKPETTTPSSSAKVFLNEKALNRIKENINILEKNIVDTDKNIQSSQSNAKTVSEEFKEVEKLLVEVADLQKRYRSYLAQSEKELKKNEEAVKKLDDWEKQTRTARASRRGASEEDEMKEKAEMEGVSRDRTGRLRWRQDSLDKMDKVRELLRGTDNHLRLLEERKATLKALENDWLGRERDFKKQLSVYKEKKAGLEKVLKD